jgi:hypothetical protein
MAKDIPGVIPDYASAEFLSRFLQFFQFDDGTPDHDTHRRLHDYVLNASVRNPRHIEFRRIFGHFFEPKPRDPHPAKLPYRDFLNCRYWLQLAVYLKFHAGFTCQICGKKPFPLGQGLEVHHKTYAHRGCEYPDHLDDLEVLCRDCHASRHSEEPELTR